MSIVRAEKELDTNSATLTNMFATINEGSDLSIALSTRKKSIALRIGVAFPIIRFNNRNGITENFLNFWIMILFFLAKKTRVLITTGFNSVNTWGKCNTLTFDFLRIICSIILYGASV
jgi:hypothetical protein